MKSNLLKSINALQNILNSIYSIALNQQQTKLLDTYFFEKNRKNLCDEYTIFHIYLFNLSENFLCEYDPHYITFTLLRIFLNNPEKNHKVIQAS